MESFKFSINEISKLSDFLLLEGGALSLGMTGLEKTFFPPWALLGTVFARFSSAIIGSGNVTDVGFFHQISPADELCTGPHGPAPSFVGWIGLKDDTDATPKRSFFWCVCSPYHGDHLCAGTGTQKKTLLTHL